MQFDAMARTASGASTAERIQADYNTTHLVVRMASDNYAGHDILGSVICTMHTPRFRQQAPQPGFLFGIPSLFQ